MAYIKGINREQIVLFPDCIDDYIAEDNPVKFIEAFVDSLDLKKLKFKYSDPKPVGRPPYDPADMLKLYIYGYLNKIRSSRKLETETKRNLELMWLLKKLVPDFKTIADYRKDNLRPIKLACRQFTLLCKKLDLFGGELVAIDGSKFRASNGKKRNFSKAKLKKFINKIDEKVNSYLSELDARDRDEIGAGKMSAKDLQEKIEALKNRKDTYHKLLDELKESGEGEVSLTDPDARSMMNNQKVEVCYNIQTTVDSKHKLIADADVVNTPADQHELYYMARRAKVVLGVDEFDVLADKGYYEGLEIKRCLDEGITTYIPKPAMKGHKSKAAIYHKENFTYDKLRDVYICPVGQKLKFKKQILARGKTMRLYMTDACQCCPVKSKCTENKQGRAIQRWEHQEILDDMQIRVLAHQELIRTRQWLSEHPFGTIKRWFDQGYMLLRGLKKVKVEINLSVLSYNIKRAIKIVGVKGLIEALA